MSNNHPSTTRIALGISVALMVVMASRTLLPLWLPLLLAAWFADLAKPASQRLEVRLHGKRRAASIVAVLLVVLALSPIAIVILSLAGDATRLVNNVLESQSVESALSSLTASEGGPTDLRSLLKQPQRILELIRSGGSSALSFAGSVAGATIAVVIGLVVFVMGFYVFLADGARIGAWLERNLPLSRRDFRRFSAALFETGRGLIIGVGLAALAQGAIAGVGYLIAGLPHAFALALLTAAAALVPSLGSGLVWAPVGVVLAFSGRFVDAAVVLGVGSVAGLADNFIRPVLSRFGRLRVPTFVLLCAMLGGVMAFGAAGLVVGPLFVRLAMEGLRLWRRPNPAILLSSTSTEPESMGSGVAVRDASERALSKHRATDRTESSPA